MHTGVWSFRELMNKSRFRAFELLIVAAVCLAGFGLYSIFLGQDINFDQRVYHTYSGWALNTRMTRDLFVAGYQTFFHQFIYAPFYFLISTFTPKTAGALLGALHGLNAVLVYALACLVIEVEPRRFRIFLAAVVTAAGIFSPMFLSELGTSFADDICSLILLAALLILLGATRWNGSFAGVMLWLAAAGGLLGAVTGLKLTNALYLCGSLPALLLLGNRWRLRFFRLAAFLAGALAGFSAVAGNLAWTLWREFRNPFYPYYNHVFKSPFFAPADVTDGRWPPTSLEHAISYPFRWMVGSAPSPSNELPFRDLRFGLIVVLALLAGVLYIVHCFGEEYLTANRLKESRQDRLIRPRAAGVLILFFTCSFTVWLAKFGIQRYIVALELLAGLVLLALLDFLVRNRTAKLATFMLVCVLSILAVKVPDWGRTPWSQDWYGLTIPPELRAANTMFLVTSVPIAYVCPLLPRSSRFVFLADPHGRFPDGLDSMPALRDRILQIARSHTGPVRLLGEEQFFTSNRSSQVDRWVNFYGFRRVPGYVRLNSKAGAFLSCRLEALLFLPDPAALVHVGTADGGGLAGYKTGVLNLGQVFSAEVVLRASAQQQPYATIVSNHPGNLNFRGMTIEQVAAQTNLFVVGLGAGDRWMSVGQFAITPGRPAYVCVVVDGRQARLFLDGRLVRKALLPKLLAQSDYPLTVGNWILNDRPFAGTIEEVHILTRALRDAEVREHAKRIAAETSGQDTALGRPSPGCAGSVTDSRVLRPGKVSLGTDDSRPAVL